MPFDMDTNGIESPGQILGNIPPGIYHVLVKDVDDSSDEARQKEQVRLDLEVLAGTVPGQAGKARRDYISCKGKGLERVKALAMILGLIRPGERKVVDFKAAVGKTLIVEWETHEYQGKKNIQIPWGGMWAIDDPSKTDIPKDKDFLLGGANGGGQPAQATQATTPPAHPAAAATAKGNNWSDV